MKRVLLRASRMVVLSTVGFALLAIGIALIPLPGPGSLIILAGIAVLAREYLWARRLSSRMRATARQLHRRAVQRREPQPHPVQGVRDRAPDTTSAPERHDIPA
jgi:uncharacterized protein (TIGR02611 family)